MVVHFYNIVNTLTDWHILVLMYSMKKHLHTPHEVVYYTTFLGSAILQCHTVVHYFPAVSTTVTLLHGTSLSVNITCTGHVRSSLRLRLGIKR